MKYADVFCIDKADLRRPALAEEMRIDTKGNLPVKQRGYKLGKKEREVMEKEVNG